jgi:hypothetical protein
MAFDIAVAPLFIKGLIVLDAGTGRKSQVGDGPDKANLTTEAQRHRENLESD